MITAHSALPYRLTGAAQQHACTQRRPPRPITTSPAGTTLGVSGRARPSKTCYADAPSAELATELPVALPLRQVASKGSRAAGQIGTWARNTALDKTNPAQGALRRP